MWSPTNGLAEPDCQVRRYGSSLPPLTLVTVTLPLFRLVDWTVCEVTFPASRLHVPVTILLPLDVTSVLYSSSRSCSFLLLDYCWLSLI